MREVIHTESHAEDHPMHAARRRTLTVLIVIGLSLLWAAAAFAVGTGPARAGSGHVVQIENFAYAPAELTIQAGDTVTWTNLDDQAHTATATDGSWDTGMLDQGASGSVTFTAPGTYDYLCTPHPTMTGRIIVVAAPAPTPTTGGGGSLPDVAMSAGGGTSVLLMLLGTVLLGLGGLAAGAVAVRGGRGQSGEG